MDLSSWLTVILIMIISILVIYVVYMSSEHGTFKRMGIPGPTPVPLLGNIDQMLKKGPHKVQQYFYHKYSDHKVFGVYDCKCPTLVIRDLDMLRDITVKHFGSFVNRKQFQMNEPFNHLLTMLTDDHWKDVRARVSPTFSTGKLRRMFRHVSRSTEHLLEHLREHRASGEPVELKYVMSSFTMDVIAGTGFGLQLDTFKNKDNEFVPRANSIMGMLGRLIGATLFFPFMKPKWWDRLGIRIFKKEDVDFFKHFTDEALRQRKEASSNSKRNDFIQLLSEAQANGNVDETDNDNMTSEEANALKTTSKRRPLSDDDIYGQSLIFLLAGFDTVSTVLGFACFLLAQYPSCCQKLQKEIDEKLGGKEVTYENIQELTYLDQCLNETMRLFPPGFVIDRVCNSDVTIGGVYIPKGMVVQFPLYAIHRDPAIWPDPETFDPDRFTPENKAKRHPYAHLPFGQGPRNCIGMRLALLEMKVALSTILQEMTPVVCAKSVFPVKFNFFAMTAADGLWVSLEQRNRVRS